MNFSLSLRCTEPKTLEKGKKIFFLALLCLGSGVSLRASAPEHVAVCPLEFSDTRFVTSEDALRKFCADLEGYFTRQALGKSFSVSLYPPVTLPKEHAWYGANTTSVRDAELPGGILEACAKYKTAADHYIFIVAGPSESYGEDASWFWPQVLDFTNFGMAVFVEGRRITKFAVCTEQTAPGTPSGIGDACHELGHLIGLSDLYDTDGALSGGVGPGMGGEYALMDTGCRAGNGTTPPDLCAVELDELGCGNVKPASKGACTLPPLEDGGPFIRVDAAEGVRYLLECRRDKGLVISRVDRSEADAGYSDFYKKTLTAAQRWKFNEVNCNPAHQCAAIVYDGGADWFACDEMPLCVSGIRRNGDGTVSFSLLAPLSVVDIDVLQTCAIFNLESDFPATEISACRISLRDADGRDAGSAETQGAAVGMRIMMKGLTPASAYTADIEVSTHAGAVFRRSAGFTTPDYLDGVIPFIYIGADKSSLPLVLFNRDSRDVRWKFNGVRVAPDSDGWWKVPGNGVLEAAYPEADGSTTTIRKFIRQ